jgi:hypothetical protein
MIHQTVREPGDDVPSAHHQTLKPQAAARIPNTIHRQHVEVRLRGKRLHHQAHVRAHHNGAKLAVAVVGRVVGTGEAAVGGGGAGAVQHAEETS